MDDKFVKDSDFFDMLAVHNPFGLRDSEGKLKWYPSLMQCYKDMIVRLLPYEYLDPVLFVCQTWGVSSAGGSRLVKSWGGEYRKPCYYIKFSWVKDIEGTKMKVAEFLNHCLCMKGQTFNETAFNLAFDYVTDPPYFQHFSND